VIQPKSLSDELLFTTVRIETEGASGTLWHGTGFFFRFTTDNPQGFPVIVTNRHVVKGAKIGRFSIHEGVLDGDTFVPACTSDRIELEDFESKWIGHPDPDVDLCGMRLQPLLDSAEERGKALFTMNFGAKDVLTEEKMSKLKAAEPILMVGYPNGLWDQSNNLPLLRRGITSSHPGMNFCWRPEFVIDCAVFPGSSGSPVALLDDGAYELETVNGVSGIGIGGRFALLGVLCAVPYVTPDGGIVVRSPAPTATTPSSLANRMINLGYVIKAREILVLGEYMKSLLVKDDIGPDSKVG
jgi:hypothetical protein